MDLGLSGKVALVTGASRGIGLAIAQGLAAEGVKLCIAARGAEDLQKAAAVLEADGADVLAMTCDAGDDASVEALIAAANERFGRIDIVVSNASPIAVGPTREDWDKSLSVDLMGAVRLVEGTLPGMEERGEGSILLISSGSAIEAGPSMDYAYTAAKAAMVAYSKKLANIAAKKGVRVNVLLPGSIEFPGGGWEQIQRETPEIYEMVRSRIPFGRLGRPEEVADAAVWMVSERASWINGTSLGVDGGQSKSIR
ncbi:MAG: SDR family oxidoreductase [Erythrobacter sp.]|nr:SDR family oxidoreductase [Erythrobacter sp.]